MAPGSHVLGVMPTTSYIYKHHPEGRWANGLGTQAGLFVPDGKYRVTVKFKTDADKDPQTQQLRTMTSSLVVAPRNVVAALDLAVNNITNRLQAMPPGLPIPAP